MEHVFVIAPQGKVGPLTSEEVRRLIERRDVEPHSWAWIAGMDAWRPLREVLPGLFSEGEQEARRHGLLAWGVGTALTGLVIACVGFLMLTHHPSIAALFGARLAFGMPWTSLDAQKIQVAAFGASMVLAYGAIVLGVGVAMVSRGHRQSVAADPDHT